MATGTVSRSWIFVVLACFLLTFVQAFYFELFERDPERCFIEEYDDNESTIRGSYKAIQFDKGNKQTREGSVHITVRSPDKVEILSREYKKEGTFAYMTSKGGSYELCFHRIKASDQVTRVYLHYEEKTKDTQKTEDFLDFHEEKTRADQDPEEHEREEREQEERERESKGEKGESQENESELEKKERMRKEKEEEERERAEDEAREKKEKEKESQHDKDKTKAEKEEEEKERAADEAGEKKEKSQHEDESEGEKDEGEDTERRGKKRPIAQRVISAADEKYDLVWQMYMRYKKREKVFRNLSKTTNSRVLWWGFLQIVVLALTAAWQMRHLTKFFILKKIV
eukprot:Seg2005.4 transcript_id=Seg2005.4/GoldUCD/mRNA.D3Y31 product="Protein split ends" protein_id=Seg2005.4/GoldUCD/D3Y31